MSVVITSVDVLVVVGLVIVVSIFFPRLFDLPLVGWNVKDLKGEQ
jgi:hypothetical protein